MKFAVFLIVYLSRLILLYVLDSQERIMQRPFFRSVLLALSLSITDSAWKKDEEYPIESKNALMVMCMLTTIENGISVLYSAFLTASVSIVI